MGRAISKRTRFEVFKRDGFVCQYCGAHPPDALLECDHINPVAGGGSNDMDNLVTACEACNRGKSDVPLGAVPQSLQAKAKEVAEREAQLSGYYEVLEARRQRIEDEIWRIAVVLKTNAETDGFHRPHLVSIKNFIERIGFYEVLEAAEIAARSKPWAFGQKWKYFCGVCWRKIRRAEGLE